MGQEDEIEGHGGSHAGDTSYKEMQREGTCLVPAWLEDVLAPVYFRLVLTDLSA